MVQVFVSTSQHPTRTPISVRDVCQAVLLNVLSCWVTRYLQCSSSFHLLHSCSILFGSSSSSSSWTSGARLVQDSTVPGWTSSPPLPARQSFPHLVSRPCVHIGSRPAKLCLLAGDLRRPAQAWSLKADPSTTKFATENELPILLGAEDVVVLVRRAQLHHVPELRDPCPGRQRTHTAFSP